MMYLLLSCPMQNQLTPYTASQQQREEVVHNMEKRKAQLECMVEESHAKLANHHAGEDVMEQKVS